MAATPMQNENIVLLPEPEPPAEWECCGSECGDACIFEIYRREKAAYDAAIKALNNQQEQS